MSSDSLPPTDTVTPAATPPFAFQPPPGGDVSLSSCDGTVFRAHSVMLGLSSTVFEGMFSGADTRADTIDLAEDAEAVSLMLAFIYPTTLPPITTINLLEKSMLVAHKYEVRRAIELIESTFQSDNPLLTLDPIRILGASAKYGFSGIRTMATKSLCSKGDDLLSIDGLTRLARALPDSSHVISLMGVLCLRMKVLDELLIEKPLASGIYPSYSSRSYAGDDFDYYPQGNDYGSYMTCSDCWKYRRIPSAFRYIPGWYQVWALRLRAALLQQPISSCEGYFNISCISGFQNTESEACSSCMANTMSKGPMFDTWGQSVRLKVQEALVALNVVYSL